VNNPRNIGVALLAVALLIYMTVTSPGYEAAADARRQVENVRHETDEASRRLVDAERRAAFLGRAAAFMSQSSGGVDSIQRVRVGIVRTLRDVGISHVRLEVRPTSSTGVATVSLSADAGFFELMQLVAHLTRPGSGIVLQRLGLGGDPSSATIDAVAIGAAP
jgi:hypothetical protein